MKKFGHLNKSSILFQDFSQIQASFKSVQNKRGSQQEDFHGSRLIGGTLLRQGLKKQSS